VKLLAIDTASPIASVALVTDDQVLAEATSDSRGHRADLLVLIDGVCTRAGVTPRELAAIVVGAGPGSFTGLRIGMATAKGIAFALGRPLWAVSSLAALASHALGDDPELVAVGVLDARRGEVFAGAYRQTDHRIEAAADERALPPGELAAYGAAIGAARVRFVGDALRAYPELAALDATWGITPAAAAVARLALTGTRADVLVSGTPTYIRPAEAEILYPDGVPGALRKR
jgi:tRNA threonylcarbamoyladenosine biosynthesis protein TsaB